MIRNVVVKIYKYMQEHYLTFILLVKLKELGITRRINFYLSHSDDSILRQTPNKEMLDSRQFFQKHRDIIEDNCRLLSDEKSKEVYKACIKYREYRETIPSELYSEHDQYFVKDIIHLNDGEVFIDGGAYTGDTVQQFIDVSRESKVKKYKIIAFEPSSKYYLLIRKFFGNNRHVKIVKKGLSDDARKLHFNECGANSQIVEEGSKYTEVIETTAIDKLKYNNKVTYIKMDIEGEEYNALQGARNTIATYKPKLAICIYHSNEDMVRIIPFIHEIVPEYKLYIRHHSKSSVETVLYAVLE